MEKSWSAGNLSSWCEFQFNFCPLQNHTQPKESAHKLSLGIQFDIRRYTVQNLCTRITGELYGVGNFKQSLKSIFLLIGSDGFGPE